MFTGYLLDCFSHNVKQEDQSKLQNSQMTFFSLENGANYLALLLLHQRPNHCLSFLYLPSPLVSSALCASSIKVRTVSSMITVTWRSNSRICLAILMMKNVLTMKPET